MDTNPLVIAIISTLGGATVLKLIVSHFLNRGKVRVDEADKIRQELRSEIKRKNTEIRELGERLTVCEAQLEKAKAYRLDVYRTLVDAGANRELLNAVLAIQ